MAKETQELSEANKPSGLPREAKKLMQLSPAERKALKLFREFNELKDRLKDAIDFAISLNGKNQLLREAANGEIYEAIFEVDRKMNLGLSLEKN